MTPLRRNLIVSLVLAAVAVLASGVVLGSTLIGVNFVGKASYTPSMEPAEQAGALPQSHWNNAIGGSGSDVPLFDADGSPTGMLLTWRATTGYTRITDAPGDARMMRGYLAPLSGEPISVKASGLDSVFGVSPYSLIVYFDGYNTAEDWVIRFTAGGASQLGIDKTGTHFSGTFVPDTGTGGNYIRFDHLTGDTFTLEAASAVKGVGSAAINGIQLLHTPEPATLALLALGAAALAGRRRAPPK